VMGGSTPVMTKKRAVERVWEDEGFSKGGEARGHCHGAGKHGSHVEV